MKYNFFDSDRHISEPSDLWEKYLPEKYKQYAPKLEDFLEESQNGQVVSVKKLALQDHPLLRNFKKITQDNSIRTNYEFGDPHTAASEPNQQLAWMKKQGVDRAAIFPSLASYCVYNRYISSEFSRAFAKSYNIWLTEYCASNTHKLIGCALISRHDPNKILEDLKIIIHQGWKTIVMRSEVINDHGIGSPKLASFWDSCEAHGISIAFHGGTHLQGDTAGSDRFTSRFALHACSHPFEAQMAFVSLLESGVLEKHPKLKIAFLEAGASWLPYWLWRLDNICFEESYEEVKDNIKMKPSDYFKRQCWIGIELGEPCIQEVKNMIGIEKLLFGTDFPHPDHLSLTTEKIGGEQCPFGAEKLTSTEIEHILEKNPEIFFNV